MPRSIYGNKQPTARSWFPLRSRRVDRLFEPLIIKLATVGLLIGYINCMYVGPTVREVLQVTCYCSFSSPNWWQQLSNNNYLMLPDPFGMRREGWARCAIWPKNLLMQLALPMNWLKRNFCNHCRHIGGLAVKISLRISTFRPRLYTSFFPVV